MGKQWKQCQTLFWGAPKSLQMVTAAMRLRRLFLGRKAMTNLDSILKSRDINYFANKSLSNQSYGFSSSHVGMCWNVRKLSAKVVMLLNCGVGEGSWESLGQQGDPTSPRWRKSVLNIHWKDWCWSWNSNTLATWCKELTHLKRPWFSERLNVEGEVDNRWWDSWMSSLTWCIWVWVSSGS